MNIGEIINFLQMLPENTPILNAPKNAYTHQGKEKGIAFVIGTTPFDQNETRDVKGMLETFNQLLTMTFPSGKGEMKVSAKTDIYLVERMHQPGVGIKGIMFTNEGIVFVPKEYSF